MNARRAAAVVGLSFAVVLASFAAYMGSYYALLDCFVMDEASACIGIAAPRYHIDSKLVASFFRPAFEFDCWIQLHGW